MYLMCLYHLYLIVLVLHTSYQILLDKLYLHTISFCFSQTNVYNYLLHLQLLLKN
nr:MAG TPA: hypothetical protein [Caudoviricetes sp.]